MTTESGPANLKRGGRERLRGLLIGLTVGMMNSLVGIGGGVLMVPALIFLRGLSVQQAAATSLAVILLLSSVALVGHTLISGFDHAVYDVLPLMISGALAAQLGAWVLRRSSERNVLLVFSLVTIVLASYMVTLSLGVTPALLDLQGAKPPLWGYLLIGLNAGFFAGLLGIGGGGMVVLGFSLLFRASVLDSILPALCVNLANASSGVLGQRRSGNVRWAEVGALVPAALVGIALGLVAAHYLPTETLRFLFALLFGGMGIRIFLRALRPTPPRPPPDAKPPDAMPPEAMPPDVTVPSSSG